MGIRFYNLHEIMKISSNFDLENYGYFRTNPLNPDITFLKTNFDFNKENYQRAGLKFWGGGGKLYFESILYRIPFQKILIEDLEKKKTKVKFNRISKRFEIKPLMNLLLEVKLLQKGYTFVHGAGVAVNDTGYLISGFAESGKSLTALKFCRAKGAKLLGDDAVILSKNGSIYPFPTKVNVFSGSDLAKEIKFSMFERICGKFRYLFSKMPPLYFLIDANLRLDHRRLADIGEKAKLERIVLLHKNKKKIRNEEVAAHILNLTLPAFLSDFACGIFYNYCYLNDFQFEFARKMEEVLRSATVGARTEENPFM